MFFWQELKCKLSNLLVLNCSKRVLYTSILFIYIFSLHK